MTERTALYAEKLKREEKGIAYKALNKRYMTYGNEKFCNLYFDEHVFRFLTTIKVDREAYFYCNMKEIEPNVFESEHAIVTFYKDGTLPKIKYKDPNVVLFGPKFFSIYDKTPLEDHRYSEETVEGYQTRLFFDIDTPGIDIDETEKAIREYVKTTYGKEIRTTILKNDLFYKYHIITNLVVTFQTAKKISTELNKIWGKPLIDTLLHSGKVRSLRAPGCQKFSKTSDIAGKYVPMNPEEPKRNCYITPAEDDIVLEEDLTNFMYPCVDILDTETLEIERWCKGKKINKRHIDKDSFVMKDGVMITKLDVLTSKVLLDKEVKYGLFGVVKKYTADGVVLKNHLRTLTVIPLHNVPEYLVPDDPDLPDISILDVTNRKIKSQSAHSDVYFSINTNHEKDLFLDSKGVMYYLE